MITEQIANELNLILQRIFCLPITRSTFRDLQQAVFTVVQGDQGKAQTLFEILFNGTIKDGTAEKGSYEKIKGMIERYTIPCRMSKEVFERGDFLAGISSEVLTQDNQLIFINRVKKIDGSELQFLLDTQGALYLAHHFLSRMEEVKKTPGQQEKLKTFRKELEDIKNRVEKVLKDEKF